MAWSRTALLVVANAILMLRAGLQSDSSELISLGILLCVIAPTIAVFGWRRRAQMSSRLPAAPHPLVMAALSAVTLACGIGGLWALVSLA